MPGSKTARIIDQFEYSIVLYQLENDVQEHQDSNEASKVVFQGCATVEEIFR